jgi:hypothetical protein
MDFELPNSALPIGVSQAGSSPLSVACGTLAEAPAPLH